MIFRVLGCSGSESHMEHPCSFAIGDRGILDMGSAATRLTLSEQLKITDILLTHPHLDHSKDLAFFAENVFAKIDHQVRVHATADSIEKIRTHLLGGALWPDFSGLPNRENAIMAFEEIEPEKEFEMCGTRVLGIPVDHPGGCLGYFIQSEEGVLLHSGDTGPTDRIWEEAGKRAKDLKAVLLEVSFPNRLQDVADASGHLTPQAFAQEIQKFSAVSAPIFVYHIKAPYRQETLAELAEIPDPRIRILEAGMKIPF